VIGHEGFIRCRSNVGKGTSFRVLIPLSTDVATADIAQPRFENVVEFDDKTERPIAKKILVIDDEEAVLDLCSQLMEFNGWDVISAVGGKAGLDQIEEHLNEIACILVDVVMPEMGANELLNELEERQVNIPVVLMSGFSQTRLEFFLERENVSSIVQKPFRANEIKRAILDAAQEETAAFVSSSRIEAPDNPK
jgi:FixJ family two-component response regulator